MVAQRDSFRFWSYGYLKFEGELVSFIPLKNTLGS